MELLRILTAGSVDDGKSTLIGRLFHDLNRIPDDLLQSIQKSSDQQGNDFLNLALFTDGLKAERAQGITIDVAYRYLQTSNRNYIFADSPGHTEYTRNMVTAATQSDAVMVMVDAERGITAQTLRHTWIAQWLGIRDFAFCINKLDLLPNPHARFLELKAELSRNLAPFQHKITASFVALSALKGLGVVSAYPEFSGEPVTTLLEWMKQVPITRNHDQAPMRFSVQGMLHPKHAKDFNYRGYFGSVVSGTVQAGDSILIAKNDVVSKVKAVERFGHAVQSAKAGEAITLLLDDEHDLSRGDLIVSQANPTHSSKRWEVELCFLNAKTIQIPARFFARIETFETKALVESVSAELDLETLDWSPTENQTISPNRIVKAVLKFQNEVSSDSFSENSNSGKMILIHDPSLETVAAVLLMSPLDPLG